MLTSVYKFGGPKIFGGDRSQRIFENSVEFAKIWLGQSLYSKQKFKIQLPAEFDDNSV
jgi:hypothetical protein